MKKITLLLLTFFYCVVGYSQFPENFEDPSVTVPTGFPTGWLVTDNGVGTGQSWTIANNASVVISGTKSAYLNREEIGMGNTSEDWLISPSTAIPTNGQLRFFTKQSLAGDNGSIYQIRISSGAQSNLGAYTVIKQWTEAELNATYNVAEEKVVDFPAAAGGQDRFIAFVRVVTQPTGAVAGDRWSLDDINVVQKCIAPSALDANTIAASSANLLWNASAGSQGYDIGIIPATETFQGVVTASSTTNNYLATGLTQNTNYKYYVRSNCGSGNFSEWVGPFNFSTLAIGTACSDPIVIGALPFQTTDNTGNYGNTLVGPQLGTCISGGVNYQSGNDVFYSYTAAEDCTVSFTLDPTQTRSSMFIYPSCAGVTGPCLAAVGNTTSAQRVINYAVTAGTTYIIVISSNSQTPTIGYNLLIQCEGCTEKPTDLLVTNPTLNGATFTWTAPTPAPLSYEVSVQPLGSPVPAEGSAVYSGITGTTFTPNDLTAATQYQYWVRSECTPGNFSAWSGPIPFNTQLCAPEDQCTYIFRMTDSANNGWNGARMQIRQNGIVLETIGATYNSGAGPVDVLVTMCNNVPFDIFWSVGGSQPQQSIVSVVNSYGQTIATINGANATVGTSIYNGIVNCSTPLCNLAPTNVTVDPITTTGGTINWDAPATENVGFDIYIVAAGSPAPVSGTAPTYTGVNGASAPFSFSIPVPNDLTPDTSYDVYVRVLCNQPGNSPWSEVKTFKTLPTCPKPTNQTVAGITTSGATLGWTEAGTATEWEVLLLAAPNAIAPAAPGITPVVGAGDIYIQNLTATTATPTLQNATIYYYYVRSVCQPGDDASTWTGPFIFNTITCDPADKCNFKFLLTNTTNNNWNGGRVQVRQNGIVVATLGTGGVNNANGITVPLCSDVPYDLFWSVEGNFPEGMGLKVVTPFLDVVYTKVAGVGTPLTVLYSNTSLNNCTPPSCPKPTNLLVNGVTQTSADLSWTEEGSATAWEVYVVEEGGEQPTNVPVNSGLPGYYSATTNTNFIAGGLTEGTKYEYYVRAICSPTDVSTWTLLTPKGFITKPVNDECAEAIVVPVNADRTCTETVTGNTLGGTASAENSNCPGTENDDIWYSFVATNAFHIISLSDIVGTTTNIRYAVYKGSDCGTLEQIFCSPTNVNTSIIGGLIAEEDYKIRVYTTGNNINQSASFTLCITTPAPITNDECATAIPAVVNQGLDCIAVTAGSITGATASPEASSCAGLEDDDVWFSFVATSSTHIITFQNIVGTSTSLNSSLYTGDVCGNLTFIACHNNNQTLVNNLTPGTSYKIRVWSTSSQLEDIRFDLCIGSIVPPITVSTTQYTKPQLVTDVLIKSTCATVSNITWATGTTTGTNGIGYFNRGESNFPFEDGIVLVTGSAAAVPGPNNTTLGNGGLGGDADLSAILAAQTPPQTGSLNNATKLEFDFVALTTAVNFNFMFASEEYGTFQCSYSDAFAFILTDVTAGTAPVNLAVIPGTNIPVSVVNIRDSQYNGSCGSENAAYFGNYYNNPAGVLGAPIDFNGITIPMQASSTVIPGNTYHIKMVIADYNDSSYDSAVFLEGGSFDIGNIELPEDYLISDGTALCLGEDVTLDSQLDPTLYDIQWYNGETLIPGATNPVLVVSESGTYFIHAAYVGTNCVTIDSVVVEYFIDEVAVPPADLVLCDASGEGMFNLTDTEAEILSIFEPGTHEVLYFLTEQDAINNENALTQAEAEAFLGTNGQVIWVRINLLTTSCFQTTSFNLVVQDLTPQFTLDGKMEICPEETTTITVIPTDNNFNVNSVTFEWTFNDEVIAGATSSSLVIEGEEGYGTYTVTVNFGGCIATQSFDIVASTEAWTLSFVGEPYVICEGESTTLSFTGVNFDIDNADATYTWTSPSGETGNGKTFSADEVGTYTLTVDILGCISTFDVQVAENDLAIAIDFTQGCLNNAYRLVANPFNESFVVATSTFEWSGPAVIATDEANVILLGANGTYTVKVTNAEGCSATETITVNNISCMIQKGISPNNDGDNDFFDLSALNVKELFIYNRYGTEVYNMPGYTNQWNGLSSGGKELPDGTYFYVIKTQAGESITGWIFINR